MTMKIVEGDKNPTTFEDVSVGDVFAYYNEEEKKRYYHLKIDSKYPENVFSFDDNQVCSFDNKTPIVAVNSKLVIE